MSKQLIDVPGAPVQELLDFDDFNNDTTQYLPNTIQTSEQAAPASGVWQDPLFTHKTLASMEDEIEPMETLFEMASQFEALIPTQEWDAGNDDNGPHNFNGGCYAVDVGSYIVEPSPAVVGVGADTVACPSSDNGTQKRAREEQGDVDSGPGDDRPPKRSKTVEGGSTDMAADSSNIVQGSDDFIEDFFDFQAYYSDHPKMNISSTSSTTFNYQPSLDERTTAITANHQPDLYTQQTSHIRLPKFLPAGFGRKKIQGMGDKNILNRHKSVVGTIEGVHNGKQSGMSNVSGAFSTKRPQKRGREEGDGEDEELNGNKQSKGAHGQTVAPMGMGSKTSTPTSSKGPSDHQQGAQRQLQIGPRTGATQQQTGLGDRSPHGHPSEGNGLFHHPVYTHNASATGLPRAAPNPDVTEQPRYDANSPRQLPAFQRLIPLSQSAAPLRNPTDPQPPSRPSGTQNTAHSTCTGRSSEHIRSLQEAEGRSMWALQVLAQPATQHQHTSGSPASGDRSPGPNQAPPQQLKQSATMRPTQRAEDSSGEQHARRQQVQGVEVLSQQDVGSRTSFCNPLALQRRGRCVTEEIQAQPSGVVNGYQQHTGVTGPLPRPIPHSMQGNMNPHQQRGNFGKPSPSGIPESYRQGTGSVPQAPQQSTTGGRQLQPPSGTHGTQQHSETMEHPQALNTMYRIPNMTQSYQPSMNAGEHRQAGPHVQRGPQGGESLTHPAQGGNATRGFSSARKRSHQAMMGQDGGRQQRSNGMQSAQYQQGAPEYRPRHEQQRSMMTGQSQSPSALALYHGQPMHNLPDLETGNRFCNLLRPTGTGGVTWLALPNNANTQQIPGSEDYSNCRPGSGGPRATARHYLLNSLPLTRPSQQISQPVPSTVMATPNTCDNISAPILTPYKHVESNDVAGEAPPAPRAPRRVLKNSVLAGSVYASNKIPPRGVSGAPIRTISSSSPNPLSFPSSGSTSPSTPARKKRCVPRNGRTANRNSTSVSGSSPLNSSAERDTLDEASSPDSYVLDTPASQQKGEECQRASAAELERDLEEQFALLEADTERETQLGLGANSVSELELESDLDEGPSSHSTSEEDEELELERESSLVRDLEAAFEASDSAEEEGSRELEEVDEESEESEEE